MHFWNTPAGHEGVNSNLDGDEEADGNPGRWKQVGVAEHSPGENDPMQRKSSSNLETFAEQSHLPQGEAP